MSDTEEDSKDKSKRPLEVSSEGNDEVEEKRSSRKRGKNLKIFRPFGFWFLTGDTVSRRSPIEGVRPSPYTTLCS